MRWGKISRICRNTSRTTPWTEYEAGRKFEAMSILNDPRRIRISPWSPIHEFARGRVDLLMLIQREEEKKDGE